MELYHGTTKENAKQIKKDGIIEGPVYMTPRKDIAEEYGESVIEINIDKNDLLIDLDLPNGLLLDVTDAIEYLGSDHEDINDFIDNGYSVGIETDVKI